MATQEKLVAAGWVALSSNVFERAGKGGLYLALVKSDCVVYVKPTGNRVCVRSV